MATDNGEDERIAIKLQLKEFEAIHKPKEADREMQLTTYYYDLVKLDRKIADQHLQQSLVTAMVADDDAIVGMCRLEQQAVDDRRAAARLAGQQDIEIPKAAQDQVQNGSHVHEWLPRLDKNAKPDGEQDDDGDDGEVSSVAESEADINASVVSAATTAATTVTSSSTNVGRLDLLFQSLRFEESRSPVQCIVCTDDFHPSQVVTLSCNHHWCRHCVVNQFELATTNEGSWPPRCCSVRMEVGGRILSFLSPSLRARYAAKSIEWGTTNRTYCHDQTCSEFILPNTIRGRLAICPKCRQHTCAECKGQYHTSFSCPESPDDKKLREWVKENECAQCPGCKRYVQITQGCNHMM